jgi:hypothetical protein
MRHSGITKENPAYLNEELTSRTNRVIYHYNLSKPPVTVFACPAED